MRRSGCTAPGAPRSPALPGPASTSCCRAGPALALSCSPARSSTSCPPRSRRGPAAPTCSPARAGSPLSSGPGPASSARRSSSSCPPQRRGCRRSCSWPVTSRATRLEQARTTHACGQGRVFLDSLRPRKRAHDAQYSWVGTEALRLSDPRSPKVGPGGDRGSRATQRSSATTGRWWQRHEAAGQACARVRSGQGRTSSLRSGSGSAAEASPGDGKPAFEQGRRHDHGRSPPSPGAQGLPSRASSQVSGLSRVPDRSPRGP
jgi:hypothetical protein